jgi:hypothetical protein
MKLSTTFLTALAAAMITGVPSALVAQSLTGCRA